MKLEEHIEDLRESALQIMTRNQLIALLELKKYELVKEAFDNE